MAADQVSLSAYEGIPDHTLGMIIHFMTNFNNDTSEFDKFHIKKAFQKLYHYFIFFFVFLAIPGVILNILLIKDVIIRRKEFRATQKFLATNAVNDIFKCTVVLPVSMATMFLQVWLFGNFFCHVFPMIQDIPFHASTLTYFVIIYDRHKKIMNPLIPRFPSWVLLAAIWCSSCFVVIPYSVYMLHINLQQYLGDKFERVGMCIVNPADNIQEYIRALFILLYVIPLVCITYLHLKVSEEINSKLRSQFTVTLKDNRASSFLSANAIGFGDGNFPRKHSSVAFSTVTQETTTSCRPSRDDYPDIASRRFTNIDIYDEDYDWYAEKRNQSYLIKMIIVYAVCLFPLNVIRLMKHLVLETEDKTLLFDYSFLTAVWLAFVPSVTTPLLYRLWQLNLLSGLDLRDYLRLRKTSNLSDLKGDIRLVEV